MADRSSSRSGWVRRLFGGGDASAPRFGGAARLLVDGCALLESERQIAEALFCAPGPDGCGADPATPARNAWGKPAVEASVRDAQSRLAEASGAALAGRRGAVFVSGEELLVAESQLRAATARRLPLVVHADLVADDGSGRDSGRGCDGWHRMAEAGAFMVLARDAQHAIDLSLVARRLAESGLTPGVVALDAGTPASTVAPLCVPDAELVREYVGDPADEIEVPTPAQQLLFGDRRRRLPRWFDPDRAAALGLTPNGGAELAAALAGRRVFFEEHLAELARVAGQELSALTGRPLPAISTHRVEGAKHVLVLQGSAIDLAEAVVEQLHETQRSRVGVVGVHWLRPFPAQELRDALSGAELVTVVERSAGVPPRKTPLWREMHAALAGAGPRLLAATSAQLTADQLAAACRNMQAGSEALAATRLDLAPPRSDPGFPRREVLLDRVRRDYPELAQSVLEKPEPIELRSNGSRTLALSITDPPTESTLEALATALKPAKGDAYVGGRLSSTRSGSWQLRLTVSAEPSIDSVSDAPAELLLCDEAVLREQAPAPEALARGGALVVATKRDASELLEAMPATWRALVHRQELRLFRCDAGVESLIDVAVSLAAGDKPRRAEEVAVGAPAGADAPDAERDLPLAVRRFGNAGSTYDSVARFWGEYAQPRMEGAVPAPVPDPYMAAGAVPPVTSTFHDASDSRTTIPLIESVRCTGCGSCWVSCPDTALAPIALSAEALLGAALDRAEAAHHEAPDPGLGQLRRVLRQLASRVHKLVLQSGGSPLQPEHVREAFDWLVEKMGPDATERDELTSALEKTLAQLAPLGFAVTDQFFNCPRGQKQTAEFLAVALNPQACQGCGICAQVCPGEAISMEPQTERLLAETRAAWAAWEELPDTAGSTIASAAEPDGLGGLAAILMSRHCLFSVAGGLPAEAGSGERLAVRQVAAVVEYQMQRRLLAHLETLSELSERLHQTIRETLAQGTAVDDLSDLDRALEGVSSRQGKLAEVLGRLGGMGESADVDVARLKRLVGAARQIDALRTQLTEGRHGLGRARFGIVVAGKQAAEWAASFPYNPFSVPVAVDQDGTGVELAGGIARGMLAEHVEQIRTLRHAELVLEGPPDLPAREKELGQLSWTGLTPDELALCPPVIVIGSADGVRGDSTALLSDLPLKVVQLDDRDLFDAEASATDLLIGKDRAFVLSASISHPTYLYEGVSAALEFAGPAWIQIHAPSPGRHGFASSDTVGRARAAVECRVHPLVLYEPARGDRLTPRLDLEGNPAPDKDWVNTDDGGTLTPADWAAGETRFARGFTPIGDELPPARKRLASLLPLGARLPEIEVDDETRLGVGEELARAMLDCHQRWNVLQAVASAGGPFVDKLRERLEQELRATMETEIAALKQQHVAEIDGLQQTQLATQLTRLRERLMQLAGYGTGGAASEGN